MSNGRTKILVMELVVEGGGDLPFGKVRDARRIVASIVDQADPNPARPRSMTGHASIDVTLPALDEGTKPPSIIEMVAPYIEQLTGVFTKPHRDGHEIEGRLVGADAPGASALSIGAARHVLRTLLTHLSTVRFSDDSAAVGAASVALQTLINDTQVLDSELASLLAQVIAVATYTPNDSDSTE